VVRLLQERSVDYNQSWDLHGVGSWITPRLGAGGCPSASLFDFSSSLKFLIEVYENKPDEPISQEKRFCSPCPQRFPPQPPKGDRKPRILAPRWNARRQRGRASCPEDKDPVLRQPRAQADAGRFHLNRQLKLLSRVELYIRKTLQDDVSTACRSEAENQPRKHISCP